MSKEEDQRLVDLLRSILAEHPDTLFYLGDYGDFDGTCNMILKKLQVEYPELKRIFITPYITPGYWHLEAAKERYDESIYPFEDSVLPKFAISKRNEWMVDQADLVIAYVRWSWGGARTTYEYALRHKKSVVNIAND
ncbi:MAG: hypothetical protein II896_02495 [Clostridia bacterium]|nr:hypothetical protein [Clostridia bacterium]